MNPSRFVGSTSREALRQVRLTLGPDAMIVSNRRVNGGVEIVASDPTGAPIDTPSDIPYDAPSNTPPDVNVIGAIGDMRGALETRIDELLWGQQLRSAPQVAALFQTLLGYGFSTTLLRAMLNRLPPALSSKASFQWVRNELHTHLPVLRHEDNLWAPGAAIALVGPTGVGKTTTLAKLAARCIKRFGARNLVLLTTDSYRIGAHEQLKIYGQMMQVPVHVAHDVDELRRIVQDIDPGQTILIDNVGISQRDRYVAHQAAMLAGAGRPIKRLLVLNASGHGDTLDEVALSYTRDGGSPLNGCIITKLDEAARLGGALDTAIRYKLPIHYVSNGQKVPEDLAFLSAAQLVDRTLDHPAQGQAHFTPTEADFAALLSMVKIPEAESAAASVNHRRKRLLPGLLGAIGEHGFQPSQADLENACAFLDTDTASSEAIDLWTAYTGASRASASVEDGVNYLIRAAKNHLGRSDPQYVLAVHDRVSLKSSAGERADLHAAVLLTHDAQALAAPTHRLSFVPDRGAAPAAGALAVHRPGDALARQIEDVARVCGQFPLVHVFEGAVPVLWRKLALQDISWLCQCPGSVKIQIDGCATTVAALAKTLEHEPLATAKRLPLACLGNKPVDDTVFWVSCAAIEHTHRLSDPLALHLITVRIMCRGDGRLIKTLYALSNLPPAQADRHCLATWLIVQTDLKSAYRVAAQAWPLLSSGRQQDEPGHKAMTAMQLGLAAWQIKHSPRAGHARALMHGLAGKPPLTAKKSASALVKLFALKELLG